MGPLRGITLSRLDSNLRTKSAPSLPETAPRLARGTVSNTPDRIRTCDLCLRRNALKCPIAVIFA